ncbi:MAG: uroporphyrinogen decarboxylase family protein, partial [Bacillota bacterium]|nr:uroporphyrinogen decarboxylase family protein [Bacillota bacterium]
IFGFENDIIRLLKAQGFHGVGFFDDWGTQQGLIINPETWREFFKPRYREQFAIVHANDMDVYFHCCGQIQEIIPDLIEIGVDMLNISQPNVFDIEKLGYRFRGKICFVCPVSYQTTGISGQRQEILAEAGRLAVNLGCPNGGFIGYVEEYSSIGMSDENYRYCIEAFSGIEIEEEV